MTVATVSDLTYFYFTWWSQSSPWGSRSKHLYLQWLSVLEDTLTFTILPIYWLSGELSSLLQRRYINIHLWLWMDKRRQSLKLSSDLHYFTSRVHSLPWGFRLSLKSQHKQIQTLLEGNLHSVMLWGEILIIVLTILSYFREKPVSWHGTLAHEKKRRTSAKCTGRIVSLVPQNM